MKKIFSTSILLFLVNLSFAQKIATDTPKPAVCQYPKDEMKGKTQKEQLAIMRPYLECRRKHNEAIANNQKANKESDMDKQARERERMAEQQKQTQQNSNNIPTSTNPQRSDAQKDAAQRAREERQRLARERTAEEQRKKREKDES